MTDYSKKKGVKELMKRKRRGPRKGEHTVVQDAISARILDAKAKHPFLGAAKIGVIAGVSASPKTVHSVLKRNGYENVTMRTGKVYRSFEMPHVTTCGRSTTWSWGSTAFPE
jgi:hypothetical protein